MRSRKPRNSDGLPNGFYSNEVKQPRRNCRIFLKVAALALAVTWTSAVYVKSTSSSSDSAKGWNLKKVLDSTTSDDSRPAKVAKPETSHHKPDTHHHSHSHSHSHKKDKKKKKKSGSTTHTEHSDEKPVCTPSPLEQRQAYPIYGCAELKVSLIMTDGLSSL